MWIQIEGCKIKTGEGIRLEIQILEKMAVRTIQFTFNP
jgi:hypothetical protein